MKKKTSAEYFTSCNDSLILKYNTEEKQKLCENEDYDKDEVKRINPMKAKTQLQ